MIVFFVVLLIAVFLMWAVWYSNKHAKSSKEQDMSQKGFEYCGFFRASAFSWGDLWVSDGDVYLAYDKTNNVDKFVRIDEVVKVSEVTIGTRLHELEIRYRLDGEVKTFRVKGSENELLTYLDRLGYS